MSWRTLGRLEGTTLVRDPEMWVSMVLMVALSAAPGVGADTARAWLARQEQAGPATCPDPAPAAALAGPWPDDFRWPGPRDPDAAITVEASVDDGLVVLRARPSSPELRACLDDVVAGARAGRMGALGLAVPEPLVTLAEPPASPLPPVSTLGGWLAFLGFSLGASGPIDLVPRRRQTGFLEQLRSTRATEADLVVAWALASMVYTLPALALATAVYALRPAADEPWTAALHAPAFALLQVTGAVRFAIRAPDKQSGVLRLFGLVALGMVAIGVSWGLLGEGRPVAAALVPFGGIGLAVVGVLPGLPAVLADLVAVATSGALLADAARVLAAEDSVAAGADPVLARRAAGNFGPEALVLGAFGVAVGVFSGSGWSRDHPWLGVTLAFVGLLLLPALAAPRVLGIPRSELLPFGRPRATDLLGALLVVPGLLAVAPAIIAATGSVLPENDVLERFVRDFSALTDTPLERFAIGLYPAICEELLYRGAIQGLLLRAGRPWLANVGQALAFSVAHVLPIRLPWTFAFGLATGAVRQRTGSLWPSMALHLVFNVAAVTALADENPVPTAVALVGAAWLALVWLAWGRAR